MNWPGTQMSRHLPRQRLHRDVVYWAADVLFVLLMHNCLRKV